MTGEIPRLRVRINDIREEIMQLDKETKYYEILKYQFMQAILFIEDDLKRMVLISVCFFAKYSLYKYYYNIYI